VRDLDDRLDPYRRRAPFERVQPPEDRVPHRRAACRLLLQLHQLCAELLQLLAGFGDEERQELVGTLVHLGYSPSTFFTTASTSSPRNGFTMKSVAPASMASITSDSWPSAEHMITTAAGSSWTISRVASMPDL